MTTNAERTMKAIAGENLKNALTYPQYREKIDQLYEQNLVTGQEQRADYLEYTKMNMQRMNRWDKHFIPSPELQEMMSRIVEPQTWILITEGWCGDSAQIVPAVVKLASLSQRVQVKLFLRDENPGLMDQFLTDGKRSIPIVAAIDHDNRILWKWGSRPAEGQAIIDHAKATGEDMHLAKEKLQLWYARNKQEALMKELTGLIQGLEK
ncbi:MAG: thioredoxin family protein [Flavobacteriales bacterium]|nr:thioredoxin family protein [Flavobacteriales bacterium]